ncbi:MerR family transcriptional regulator [Euzebya tangerina]|uniref:MerR family transcriptional regulator n=1 Tax=Euzebya tangerina TaxID=591198 RepID=UPI000E322FCF|nr:MerR family transcriptional regulator [Euzebya tangerina]
MNGITHGSPRLRTVSDLARLAGVTVRTLHHYDEIGLLRPSARSEAGYRLYDREDLQRLQQILFWRALGFSLEEIASLLDDPEYNRVAALEDQRAALSARLDDLGLMLKAVDDALTEERGGPAVTDEAMFEAFDNAQYEEEVRERWGDTDAYAQSKARQASWTEEDKRRIIQQGIDHAKRMAQAKRRGVDPGSAEAMDLAEEARLGINREMYDCSKEMHVNLGEMYVADPRFTEYYDQHEPGLAEWYRDAIVANAER